MLYGAEVAVCPDMQTKHIKFGQKVQLLNVKPLGVLCNHYALKH
jgi:hypothetical protein